MIRSNSLRISIALTSLAFGYSSHAQDSTPASRPTNAAMQEMMKRMMPGEGHKLFARLAGKWQGTMRVWNSMYPDVAPIESATESESTLVLGGRFIQEAATGSVMRMPMQRLSLLGFDNLTQRYTLTFYSSLETATNTASGTADAEGKVITLQGEFNEPGGRVPFKNVIRLESEDVHVFESYHVMPDGKEFKVIEQVMTRVK